MSSADGAAAALVAPAGDGDPRVVQQAAVATIVDGDGHFRCPWCRAATANERGLIGHVNRSHAGALLTAPICAAFGVLGRGACPGCGHLRTTLGVSGRQCPSCKTSRVARPLQAGDRIPARAAAAAGGVVAPADPTT